jgi:predicted metalloprotease
MMRRSLADSDNRLRYRLYDRRSDNGHYDKCEWNMIELGDFKEMLCTAAAIGDDRLQKMSRGQIQPESWTHGSSEQRMTWLKRGLESGDPSICNTFEATQL